MKYIIYKQTWEEKQRIIRVWTELGIVVGEIHYIKWSEKVMHCIDTTLEKQNTLMHKWRACQVERIVSEKALKQVHDGCCCLKEKAHENEVMSLLEELGFIRQWGSD